VKLFRWDKVRPSRLSGNAVDVVVDMAEWWDTRNTRWETLFDEVAAVAASRRLSAPLSLIKRLRAWQHRQTRHGNENHSWHDAELLWLQGVALERARQRSKARVVWHRLARVFQTELRHEDWFLPRCPRCAERTLGFAPNWFTVASQLRARRNSSDVAQLLSECASGVRSTGT
jgi:hypothetical protein